MTLCPPDRSAWLFREGIRPSLADKHDRRSRDDGRRRILCPETKRKDGYQGHHASDHQGEFRLGLLVGATASQP